ncbi:DeoR/GlpR family DNA-binding transcription regulator [Microbacterium testaceum]|uniref:DeoR/GlpR family DNA-binding transcription regulator n=1 Tax=Microbacterium testaceum TaxID=2033 RepID=UPI0022E2607B|nr:DeoR/GlpR family DNA-binding transcription regulator [Microbacterium testaceum]
MRASERREEIVRMARSNGLASVEELSRAFGVTASTIRRDLSALEDSNRLARTYGGAIAVRSHHREMSLGERSVDAYRAKDAIGRRAAAQVAPGETILLDAGTTTARVAAHLIGTSPLTVVTNGMTPFREFEGAEGVELSLLGGWYRQTSQSFIGPMAEASLERWFFDAVFLGADAVTAERGLCEATATQTRLKELMARAGTRVYVVAHAAKLGASPFSAWVRLETPWTLVTDAEASEEQLEPFRRRGVEVIVAD